MDKATIIQNMKLRLEKLEKELAEMYVLREKHLRNYYDDYYSTETYAQNIAIKKGTVDDAKKTLQEYESLQEYELLQKYVDNCV